MQRSASPVMEESPEAKDPNASSQSSSLPTEMTSSFVFSRSCICTTEEPNCATDTCLATQQLPQPESRLGEQKSRNTISNPPKVWQTGRAGWA